MPGPCPTPAQAAESAYQQQLNSYQASKAAGMGDCAAAAYIRCIPPEPPDTPAHATDRALWNQQYGSLVASPDFQSAAPASQPSAAASQQAPAAQPPAAASSPNVSAQPGSDVKSQYQQMLGGGSDGSTPDDLKAWFDKAAGALGNSPETNQIVDQYRQQLADIENGAKATYAREQQQLDQIEARRQALIQQQAKEQARLQADQAALEAAQQQAASAAAQAAAQAQYDAVVAAAQAAEQQRQAQFDALQQQQQQVEAQQQADQQASESAGMAIVSGLAQGLLGGLGGVRIPKPAPSAWRYVPAPPPTSTFRYPSYPMCQDSPGHTCATR